MALLTIQDVHKTYGERHLLAGVSLVVGEGERIGLLGPNGCGKSTLLRILAGIEPPDDGLRTVRRDLRLGWLEQEPRFPAEQSVRDAVRSGLARRGEVLAELERVHASLAGEADPERLERLLRTQTRLEDELEQQGGHDVEHRIEALVHDLGLRDADARCGALSGGELRRVALARLLLGTPDLLLLDEPTNHLDAQVTDWLEDFLLQSRSTLVMVTHDRYFLDRVVGRIVELERGALHSYDGGYGDFLVARAERLDAEGKAESSRRNVLRRETEWMRRGPPARTTKAKARIGRYQALTAAAPPPAAADLAFTIPPGPRLGDRVLELVHVHHAYGDRVVIDDLSLRLEAGERLGIVGPNGAGKTTFLRLCQGLLAPSRGTVSIGPTVRFAAIDQARTQLDPTKTVLQEVAGSNDWVVVGERALRVETFLEQFLFPGAMKHSLVGSLSGGERNRVLLAKLLSAGGNVLVLDEPTNDLDLMALRVLEEALLQFEGSVLVVSHDRFFLDRVATRILHLDGSGHARLHPGDLSALLAKLAAERAEAAARSRIAAAPAPTPAPAPRAAAKLTWKEQQELAALPDRIAAAEAEVAALDARLADPQLYARPGGDPHALAADRAAAAARAESLYSRWLELEER